MLCLSPSYLHETHSFLLAPDIFQNIILPGGNNRTNLCRNSIRMNNPSELGELPEESTDVTITNNDSGAIVAPIIVDIKPREKS